MPIDRMAPSLDAVECDAHARSDGLSRSAPAARSGRDRSNQLRGRPFAAGDRSRLSADRSAARPAARTARPLRADRGEAPALRSRQLLLDLARRNAHGQRRALPSAGHDRGAPDAAARNVDRSPLARDRQESAVARERPRPVREEVLPRSLAGSRPRARGRCGGRSSRRHPHHRAARREAVVRRRDPRSRARCGDGLQPVGFGALMGAATPEA